MWEQVRVTRNKNLKIPRRKILLITALWEVRDGAPYELYKRLIEILELKKNLDMKLYALLLTGLVAQDYDYDFYGDKNQDNSFQ